MSRVTGNHQHEGLDDGVVALAGVCFQLHLHALVQAHTVVQFQPLDLLRRHAGRIEVLARDHRRLFHEAVRHRAAQGIVVDHILERHRTASRFHKRRRGQLQPENRLEFIDRTYPCTRAIAMRLVHEQHEVRQARKIIEVALANVFRQALDARRLAAAHLGIDLGDIEDVHPNAAEQRPTCRIALIVVVAGDYHGHVRGKFRDTPEHIFRRVRREIGDQLVIDGEIGRQHEKVVDAVRQVQVADERPHQPRLAHAGGEREAQRRKLALEIRH